MSVTRLPRQIPPRKKLASLAQLDGRTVLARQARKRSRMTLAAAKLSYPSRKQVLIERAALLATFCESCEATWLTGGEIDNAELCGNSIREGARPLIRVVHVGSFKCAFVVVDECPERTIDLPFRLFSFSPLCTQTRGEDSLSARSDLAWATIRLHHTI
jgi:hypothetical protein